MESLLPVFTKPRSLDDFPGSDITAFCPITESVQFFERYTVLISFLGVNADGLQNRAGRLQLHQSSTFQVPVGPTTNSPSPVETSSDVVTSQRAVLIVDFVHRDPTGISRQPL
jgi:hypothetical protein